MKRFIILVWIFCLFGLAFTGCKHFRSKSQYSVQLLPKSGAVVAGHEAKDSAVIQAADVIDTTVAGQPVESPVVAETAKMRAAVAIAPAAEIRGLLEAKDKRIAELEKQVVKLTDAENKTQVRDLRWFGYGCLAIAGVIAFAVPLHKEWSILAAIAGVLSLGLARLFSQPWFDTAVTWAVGMTIAGLAVAGYRSYKQGTLHADSTKLKDAALDTLRSIVPVIDEAKDKMPEVMAKLTDALGRAMSKPEKALIKDIRESRI